MAHRAKGIQWNCLSIANKKSELVHIVNKHKPFIICLQETWLKQDSIFKIPGFACFRNDRPDGYGGVAILVQNSFSAIPVSLSNHCNDISVVAVNVNSICYVSIYYARPSIAIFNEINQLLNNLPKPFVLLGDFNSHHQLWGCSSTTYYGEQLLDLINNHDLCILNTGEATRLARTPSAPDLSLCTPDLASLLSWSPLDSTHGSDHFPLLITFPFNKPAPLLRQPRLKYKLNDVMWEQFQFKVKQRVSELPELSKENINHCSQLFTEVLIGAADETFPAKKQGPNLIPSPPWWDEECTNAVKERKKVEKEYCTSMTDSNFDHYIEVSKSTKELLRNKKFEGWRKFCHSLCPNVKPSLVWENIRKFRSAFNKNQQNKIPSELAEKIMDRLAPPFVPDEFVINQTVPNPILDNRNGVMDLNSPFTLDELQGVLSYVKDSAPGDDGIPYSFLTHLDNDSLIYLLSLINKAFITGYVPPSWRTQDVIFLLKPQKPSTDPSSYRPIALSSTRTKVAEHLIKNRLEWFLEHNSLLSNSQFGFRKGKSTLDNLSIFTTDIRLAFSRNESVVAAFLDINAAYDNVNISILKSKMQYLKIPSLLTNFIVNIVSERFIKYSLDPSANSFLYRTVWKGLPQGSVLSPLLYNVYTYDLDSSVNNSLSILQYADDLLLYATGKIIEQVSESLNTTLGALKVWLNNNGLDLSPSKSTVVLFSRKRVLPPVHIALNNVPLLVKNQAKFLGVILDSKLTGIPHFEYALLRCEHNLNVLRCVTGVWWGAHPFTMKLLYNALIRSILDYGIFLLHPSNMNAFKKLEGVQSKALRLITGAMKSSPVNCLQVECCDPPLLLRQQYICDRYFYRCWQLKTHPLLPKISQLSDEVAASSFWKHKDAPPLVKSYRKHKSIEAATHQSSLLPLYQYNFKTLINKPKIELNLGIHKHGHGQNTNFNCIVGNKWPGWHYIFTDASKHAASSCVGIGVYHSQYKIVQQIKLPPESSVFTGEIFAILKAIEYAELAKLRDVVIFSDSLSSLQAISHFPFQRIKQAQLVFSIRDRILQCSLKGCNIIVSWIPSHVGIAGNERADRLANEAIQIGDIFPYNNYCHDLINLPRKHLHETWSHLWNSSTKGKYYRQIQKVIPCKAWFCDNPFSKKHTSILCRLRMGHVCSPAFLFRLKIVADPLCPCGEYGDVNHIFFSCPLYNRSVLFSQLLSIQIPFPTSITCLLYLNNYDVYKILVLYLELNNIKL